MTTYLRSNVLATLTVALLVSYWTFGSLIPGRWVSAFGAASIAVAGSAIAFASAKEAWGVFRAGIIGPAELGVLGIWSIGFGALYRGMWGVVWASSGFPANWIGTVHSAFGNYVMSAGCFALFLAPAAAINSIRPPRLWVIALWVMAVTGMMLVVGMQVRYEEDSRPGMVIRQNLSR